MKDPKFWKTHYVVANDAEDIAAAIRVGVFTSNGEQFDLVYLEWGLDAPNILISQGRPEAEPGSAHEAAGASVEPGNRSTRYSLTLAFAGFRPG